jgi:hypothetical protein
MFVELGVVLAIVWAVGAIFQVILCMRDLRMCMDVEENCRAKDVKNYYRSKSRKAVRNLKMAPLWPITILDPRDSVKAVKKYRELFTNNQNNR